MNSGLISTSPFFVPPFRLFLLPCNPGKPLYLRFSGRNPKFNRDLVTTRFRLILPVHSHNVTKNLTGHRIHLEGPQIYQINRQTNSFQNMCDMLYVKINRLARKNTSKSAIFVCTNMVFLNSEGPGRETVDARSTSGLPLKNWGYDGAN